MLTEGRIVQLLFLLIISGCVIFWIRRAVGGQKPFVRKMPALDAIDEAVGRSTEMGRPVHITTGHHELTDPKATAAILASVSAINYVAKLTARNKTGLVVTSGGSSSLPLCDEAIRSAYIEEGVEEDYKPEMLIYAGGGVYPFAAACMGIFERQQAAANIMLCDLHGETMMLIEAAKKVGAITIAGTQNKWQMPVTAACADYAVIGEELFATGAYLSKDPVQLGSIAGQDLAKYVVTAIILVGIVLANAGMASVLKDFFAF
jgi:hypothetical protein